MIRLTPSLGYLGPRCAYYPVRKPCGTLFHQARDLVGTRLKEAQGPLSARCEAMATVLALHLFMNLMYHTASLSNRDSGVVMTDIRQGFSETDAQGVTRLLEGLRTIEPSV